MVILPGCGGTTAAPGGTTNPGGTANPGGTTNPGDATGTINPTGVGAANGYVYVPARLRQTGLVIEPLPLSQDELTRRGLQALVKGRVWTDLGQVGTTNQGGAYSIVGVPAGSRQIHFSDSGGASLGDGITVSVADGDTTSGTQGPNGGGSGPGAVFGYVIGRRVLGLGGAGSAGQSVSGQWADLLFVPTCLGGSFGEYRPVPGIPVTLGGQTATTDADGFFLFMPVQPDQYEVSVLGHTAHVQVLAGQTVAVSEVPIRKQGAITGYLSAPATRGWGDLYFTATRPSGLSPIAGGWVGLETGQMAQTGSDGAFTLFGVAPGLHLVGAIRAGEVPIRDAAAGQAYVQAGETASVGVFPGGYVGPITLTNPMPDGIALGETVSLEAYASAPDQEVIGDFDWSSSDTNVATVNDIGVVTGRGAGSAQITARAGDQSRSVTVRVLNQQSRFPGQLLFSDGVDLWLAKNGGRTKEQITYLSGSWSGAPASSVSMADMRADGLIVAEGTPIAGGATDLFIINRQAGTMVDLTNTPTIEEHAPRFSHDGSKLAWIAIDQMPTSASAWGVYVTSAGTWSPVAVCPPTWMPTYSVCFSPADDLVVFGGMDLGSTAAAARAKAGMRELRLPGIGALRVPSQAGARATLPWGIGAVKLSTLQPAYFAATGDVMPMQVDVSSNGDLGYVGWAASASTSGQPTFEVYAMRAPNFAPEQLTSDQEMKYYVSFSPAADQLAYALFLQDPGSSGTAIDIYAVPVAGGSPIPLLASPTVEVCPRWLPAY